jgi:hypothetical protein
MFLVKQYQSLMLTTSLSYNLQMDCDAQSSQVVDPEDAADYIPP